MKSQKHKRHPQKNQHMQQDSSFQPSTAAHDTAPTPSLPTVSFFSKPAEGSQKPNPKCHTSEENEPVDKMKIPLPEEIWRMVTRGLKPC